MFIVFEGLDGAGKTTQVDLLTNRLQATGLKVLQVHEPGGTPLGDRVRRLLKHEVETALTPVAELLLFSASRAQLVSTVISPALADSTVVIADRFTASTYAYQGYGRGVPCAIIAGVQRAACQDLAPDLSILLDIPLQVSENRRAVEVTGGQPDRFEDEAAAFRERVRAGYLKLAKAPPATTGTHWVVLDGADSPDTIAELVWAAVAALLKTGNE